MFPQAFGIWRRNFQSALFEKNMEFYALFYCGLTGGRRN